MASDSGGCLQYLFDTMQVRGVIERLGPAYIKIAQAVSTRVDILSPEYLVEIELLQDRVPAFPTDLVRSLRSGWG